VLRSGKKKELTTGKPPKNGGQQKWRWEFVVGHAVLFKGHLSLSEYIWKYMKVCKDVAPYRLWLAVNNRVFREHETLPHVGNKDSDEGDPHGGH
jgi:hypothetical protein